MVQQNHRAIIERLGKFSRTLEPGLNFKVPGLEAVAYRHSLKEEVLDIERQTAITKDNVKIEINGVLYYKVVDAYKASYNINAPIRAMTMLAQTSMRSEIGLLELDRTFQERDHLNVNIKAALNDAADSWGLEVLRYEIKDIKPPAAIKRSMEFQSESERIKRSKILQSEGERQGIINIAAGYKESKVLEGQGKAAEIMQEARSTVETLKSIGASLKTPDGALSSEALRLRMAEQYVKALHSMFKEGSIIVLPAEVESQISSGNPMSASSIATAMALYKSMLVGTTSQYVVPSTPQSVQVSSKTGDNIDTVQKLIDKVNRLEQQQTSNKVRYLDDRALRE